ncbi:hypothetical protein [Bacillus sp. JCM 19041]|uniref:hypothetical protein n=1 Tax=Bacillus sp. JCM 19041 TaxID=1460637 RepID=UPI0006D11105
MFENLFTNELQTRIGQSVEVATSNDLFEGILLRVTAGLIVIVSVNGYGTGNQENIAVNAVKHVRFIENLV